MKMISCESVKAILADYAVGALNQGLSEKVEAHLMTCPACAHELDCLQRTADLVESLGAVEPPVGLWNGVYNRITSPEPEGSWWNFKGFRLPQRLAAGAAVTAAVVVMAVSTVHKPEPPVRATGASMSEYVQGHAILASEDPFADKVSLGILAGVAGEDSRNL